MKALVVSPQPFFSNRGTPLSVYYRTLITAELGVTIDLLTYGQGQDVDIPGVRIIRIPSFAIFGEVKTGPSALKLFLDIFILGKMIALLLAGKYDFVHAHEEAGFMGLLLKPLFRYKLVYDMHSSLPQQLTNFAFTRSRLLIKLFELLEKATLRSADVVITICDDLQKYVEGMIPNNNKSLLIENSIFEAVQISTNGSMENHHHKPDEQFAAFQDWKGNRKSIAYVGSLEPYQGIELVLNAFQRVLPVQPDTVLLIVGGREEQVRHYREIAQNLNLGSLVHFTGNVSQSSASRYLRLADVSLSSRVSGTNTPLKIYELLASDRPLVATRIHSHTQVLDDDVAYLVAPQPESMAKGILRALEDGDQRRNKIDKARALYETRYSRERYIEKMKTVLQRVRSCAE